MKADVLLNPEKTKDDPKSTFVPYFCRKPLIPLGPDFS